VWPMREGLDRGILRGSATATLTGNCGGPPPRLGPCVRAATVREPAQAMRIKKSEGLRQSGATLPIC